MTIRDAKIDRYIRQFMPRHRCLIDDGEEMNSQPVGFSQGGIQNVFAGTGAGGINIASNGGAMFMMGPGIFFNPFMVVPSQQPILPNVNRVIVTKFIMPFTMTFKRVVTRVASSAILGTCAFGIYSLDGNTLVLDTGGMTKPADANFRLLTKTFGPTTVPAGVYWFAWTATGTVQVPGWLFTTANTEFATDSQNSFLETPSGIFGTITNMVSTVADVTFTLSVNPVTLGFAVNDSVFTGELSNAAFAAYQNKNFIISSFPGGNAVTCLVAGGAVASAACNGSLQQNVIWLGKAVNVSTNTGGTPPNLPATLGGVIDRITAAGQYDVPAPIFIP